jgi:16S rRNA (adenine1518-N6/adenine1519-N6)-dimethyltransferase
VQTLSEIRELLAARGIAPKHRLGQNFLHDKNQLARLLHAADVQPGDLVLEVGPGTGTLTEALIERGGIVIACEIDRDLAAILADRLGGRVTLIRGDALEKGRALNPDVAAAFGGRPFKLIANLPYQVASPLITTLLIGHQNCTGLFVTIQKEVAARLAAAPGTKAYGPLSIIVQSLATVDLIGIVPPSCFWPEPEVTSAMIAIRPRRGAQRPFASGLDAAAFARYVTRLFTRRRKQLGTILGREREFPAGITADLRPEALAVDQLIALWHAADPASGGPSSTP